MSGSARRLRTRCRYPLLWFSHQLNKSYTKWDRGKSASSEILEGAEAQAAIALACKGRGMRQQAGGSGPDRITGPEFLEAAANHQVDVALISTNLEEVPGERFSFCEN